MSQESSLVFYDNRDLKISKSKKSEQYFRDKYEIFICLFDEYFVRHVESHWRETWRHIDRRTEPPISLETLPHSRVIYNLVQREAWNQISIIFTKCKSEYWPSLGHIYEQVWSVWSVKGLYMYK